MNIKKPDNVNTTPPEINTPMEDIMEVPSKKYVNIQSSRQSIIFLLSQGGFGHP